MSQLNGSTLVSEATPVVKALCKAFAELVTREVAANFPAKPVPTEAETSIPVKEPEEPSLEEEESDDESVYDWSAELQNAVELMTKLNKKMNKLFRGADKFAGRLDKFNSNVTTLNNNLVRTQRALAAESWESCSSGDSHSESDWSDSDASDGSDDSDESGDEE